MRFFVGLSLLLVVGCSDASRDGWLDKYSTKEVFYKTPWGTTIVTSHNYKNRTWIDLGNNFPNGIVLYSEVNLQRDDFWRKARGGEVKTPIRYRTKSGTVYTSYSKLRETDIMMIAKYYPAGIGDADYQLAKLFGEVD